MKNKVCLCGATDEEHHTLAGLGRHWSWVATIISESSVKISDIGFKHGVQTAESINKAFGYVVIKKVWYLRIIDSIINKFKK